MTLKHPNGCFPTTTVKTKDLSSFVITEKIYTPDLKLPKHSHERACFSLVLQGGFIEKYGSGTRICECSTVIYTPPGEDHTDHFLNAGARCLHIEIRPEWFTRLRQHSIMLNTSVDFQGGLLAPLFTKVYQEFNAIDAATAVAIEGLMLEIVAMSWRSANGHTLGKRPSHKLEQVCVFLRENFCERVSLAQIAEATNVHPVYLARAFHKHYRCTIGEYIRRLRIEYACRELSASDKPLALIAQAAGFFDQSHFSKAFKLVTGMSPALYRKHFRPS
jgi:AraC family transcriptional regulator